MFKVAAKTAAVEALRSVFDAGYPGDINYRQVGVEYPDKEAQWPALLIQFAVTGDVRWTGINPDEYGVTVDDPDWDWNAVRLGFFEGSFLLTILALSSQERDRLWDGLLEVLLMADLNDDTKVFYDTLNRHEFIGMTVLPSSVDPGSDNVSVGVPWDPKAIAYESTVSFKVTGQFMANLYERKLLALDSIELLPYREGEPVPGENDGEGAWVG